MAPVEYAALLADVGERGILTALDVTSAGVVLDGRHRLRAAQELGLPELPVRRVAVEDELAYMLLAAINRRHLSPSQRAALTVELGEIQRLRAARQAGRAKRKRANGATLPAATGRPRDLAARIAGVSPRTLQDALTVYEEDPDLFARVRRGELPAHRAAKLVRRQRRLRALPAAPPLPRDHFELIYADPPWRSTNPSSEWSPEQHYPTLSVAEIKALPVPAAEHAVLFLWAVSSQLPQALAVMQAWGFEYRTSLVWVKPAIGMGIWVRHRHELLLIGRRGGFPAPDEADRPDSVLEAPRGRHSEKPACVYELIERMYPQASKLELFARGQRPGWSAWGNEVEAA